MFGKFQRKLDDFRKTAQKKVLANSVLPPQPPSPSAQSAHHNDSSRHSKDILSERRDNPLQPRQPPSPQNTAATDRSSANNSSRPSLENTSPHSRRHHTSPHRHRRHRHDDQAEQHRRRDSEGSDAPPQPTPAAHPPPTVGPSRVGSYDNTSMAPKSPVLNRNRKDGSGRAETETETTAAVQVESAAGAGAAGWSIPESVLKYSALNRLAADYGVVCQGSAATYDASAEATHPTAITAANGSSGGNNNRGVATPKATMDAYMPVAPMSDPSKRASSRNSVVSGGGYDLSMLYSETYEATHEQLTDKPQHTSEDCDDVIHLQPALNNATPSSGGPMATAANKASDDDPHYMKSVPNGTRLETIASAAPPSSSSPPRTSAAAAAAAVEGAGHRPPSPPDFEADIHEYSSGDYNEGYTCFNRPTYTTAISRRTTTRPTVAENKNTHTPTPPQPSSATSSSAAATENIQANFSSAEYNNNGYTYVNRPAQTTAINRRRTEENQNPFPSRLSRRHSTPESRPTSAHHRTPERSDGDVDSEADAADGVGMSTLRRANDLALSQWKYVALVVKKVAEKKTWVHESRIQASRQNRMLDASALSAIPLERRDSRYSNGSVVFPADEDESLSAVRSGSEVSIYDESGAPLVVPNLSDLYDALNSEGEEEKSEGGADGGNNRPQSGAENEEEEDNDEDCADSARCNRRMNGHSHGNENERAGSEAAGHSTPDDSDSKKQQTQPTDGDDGDHDGVTTTATTTSNHHKNDQGPPHHHRPPGSPHASPKYDRMQDPRYRHQLIQHQIQQQRHQLLKQQQQQQQQQQQRPHPPPPPPRPPYSPNNAPANGRFRMSGAAGSGNPANNNNNMRMQNVNMTVPPPPRTTKGCTGRPWPQPDIRFGPRLAGGRSRFVDMTALTGIRLEDARVVKSPNWAALEPPRR